MKNRDFFSAPEDDWFDGDEGHWIVTEPMPYSDTSITVCYRHEYFTMGESGTSAPFWVTPTFLNREMEVPSLANQYGVLVDNEAQCMVKIEAIFNSLKERIKSGEVEPDWHLYVTKEGAATLARVTEEDICRAVSEGQIRPMLLSMDKEGVGWLRLSDVLEWSVEGDYSGHLVLPPMPRPLAHNVNNDYVDDSHDEDEEVKNGLTTGGILDFLL